MSALGSNLYQHGEPFWSRSNGAVLPSLVHRKNGDNSGGIVGQPPPLFAGILPADYSRISAAARVREFERGEMLFIEGDPVQQVYLLTSGFAKINKLGLSGSEVILRFSGSGDVLGAMGLFSTGRHCTTAQSFRVCRASRSCTRTWLELSVGSCWNSKSDFARWQPREWRRASPVSS